MNKARPVQKTDWRGGDAVNALLAVTLAGLAYWQGEVALQAVRDHLTKVHGDVGALQRELSALRQDQKRSAQATQHIDMATRDLLKEQRKQRSEGAPWRW